jgi:hypothetical protein
MFSFAGENFVQLGRLHEAELSFYKAISLDNTFIPAHKNLIALYRQMNDKKNLLTALMRYRALLPATDETAQQLDREIAGLRAQR